MLIKDRIKITKLSHTTKDITINIELGFKFNETDVVLKASYTPDRYKIEQESLKEYLKELLISEEFDLENLAARVVEDLYDMAVPKQIKTEISQKVDNITTKVETQKRQPIY